MDNLDELFDGMPEHVFLSPVSLPPDSTLFLRFSAPLYGRFSFSAFCIKMVSYFRNAAK